MNYKLLIGLISLTGSMACTVSEGEKADKTIGISLVDSLDIDLLQWYADSHFPGFAVSIFSKDSIYYQKGFGYANTENKQMYSPQTIQLIASISKTFIGVSLMKLVEEGKLSLEDEVNDYLPFELTHPRYPNDKITILHLATHTSSISDSENYDKTYLFEEKLQKSDFEAEWSALIDTYNENIPLEMGEFLSKVFSKDGEWYSADNFVAEKPGTSYQYSNLGATLLAYIIEQLTENSFKVFTEKQIFEPLNLRSTSWEITADDKTKQATYYRSNLMPYPHYRIITYPDGGLYSTVADLTVFLQEIIKGYAGDSKLLTKPSIASMLSKRGENPDGICWDLSIPCCVGHAGNDFGTSTLMYFEPATGIGRILFANISTDTEETEAAFYGIFNDLFKYDLR